jgi:hypothetical protein
MGLLRRFTKASTVTLVRLPSGSFTVDRAGRVLINTLPHSFPMSLVQEIGQLALQTFRSAQDAQLPLGEFVAEYTALKLTARELRGGAIIFLTPRGLAAK